VSSKEQLRTQITAGERGYCTVGAISGRIAEIVRRDDAYRRAGRIFASPSPVLKQIRINALVDGKELLVPSQGLYEGFLLLKPYQVEFKNLGYASTYKGLLQYGRKVSDEDLRSFPVAVLFTEVLAVDSSGGFIGDGNGFFDLSVAILAELHALQPDAVLYGLGDQGQVLGESIRIDPWDIRLNAFVTENGIQACSAASPLGSVVRFADLPEKRIRRITPLWRLLQQQSIDSPAHAEILAAMLRKRSLSQSPS